MSLTAIGINGCSCIAKGAHEINELVGIPLERVEVVVDENGIGPAFMGHLEGFDNPVITRLTVTAQGLTHQVGIGLVAVDGLIHDVNQFQIGVLALDLVHPFLDGFITVLCREVLNPLGIL